jgi:hypothetical protein
MTVVQDQLPPDPYGAWAAAPASRKRAGRAVLISVIVMLALVIAAVVGFVFLIADPAGAAGGCGGG